MMDYLYISKALECCKGDKKSNRDFGLANSNLCSNRFKILKEWAYSRLSIYDLKSDINKMLLSLKHLWLILIVISAIFGILSSISLLTYNGSEPVNIFYFLIFSIFLPLVGVLLTVVSIIELTTYKESIFVDLMPSYWFLLIFKKDKLKIPSLLIKSYIVYVAQVISLIFYIFMLIGLIAVISSKDVAFGWSSTLLVSSGKLYNIFEGISFLWRDILPSAVPSLSLIEHSHYYRVGEWQPKDVAELGNWWQFLSMTLIVYAITPRLIFIPITYFIYKKIEKETVLSLDDTNDVIDEICKPIIQTKADTKEDILRYDIKSNLSAQIIDKEYDYIAGWSIDTKEIKKVVSLYGIKAKDILELALNIDIKRDIKLINNIKASKVAVLVKGWEPPTLDFIDIIENLSQRGVKVDIIPLGFEDEGYRCSREDFDIWRGKIEYLNIKNTKVIKI